jgi:broad specificity phosphatase PhoE
VTTTFFLVRHAAHDNVGGFLAGRDCDVSLGEAGRAQAIQLATRMGREQIDAIHTSPRRRSRETAAAIAEVAEVEESVADDLDEIDFGAEWCGKSFDELNLDPAWRRWNEDRRGATTLAGVGLSDTQARVVQFMRNLTSDRDASVVLVSHADVIKLAVAHHLNLPFENIDRLEIAPASISTLVVGSWGAKLLTLNEPTPGAER